MNPREDGRRRHRRHFRTPPEARSYVRRAETHGVVSLDLSSGESRFGEIPQYSSIRRELELSGAFAEAARRYPKESLENSKRYVRERFGIGEDPYITFSGGGSDEILERTVYWLLNPSKTQVWGIPPHFPDTANFINRFRDRTSRGPVGENILYAPVPVPLDTTLGEKLEIAMDRVTRARVEMVGKARGNRGSAAYYFDNGNNPTGSTASLQEVEKFVSFCAERKMKVIISEAQGDAFEDNQSAIRLTEKYDNLIVLRSLSKLGGLPGERIGYAVMSKTLGESFKSVERDYPIDGPKTLLIGELMKNEILLPHFANKREEIKEAKTLLMQAFDMEGVSYLPTDPRVPLITIKGKTDQLYPRLLQLGVATTSGADYADTSNPQLGHRYVRLALPEIEDVPFVTESILRADSGPDFDHMEALAPNSIF